MANQRQIRNLDELMDGSLTERFNGFDFEWSKAYFEKRIEDAANGLI